MEVTALCIQIFMNVFVLLLTHPGTGYTVQKLALPVVSPDKLQFFEYESISVSCGGDKEINAWRVMRKRHNMSSAHVSEGCSIPAPSCTILHAFEGHSGEYWCENDEEERSRTINISVTAGPVILNLPAQPVNEGSNVTLRCINKNTKKTHIRDFYKDGVLLETHYKTDMILSNVSKSDKGLYKCYISHVGESPESWLTVVITKEEEGSNDEMETLKTQPHKLIIHLVTIFALILLVIGLIIYDKHRALNNGIVPDPKDTTNGYVEKPRRGIGERFSQRPRRSIHQNKSQTVL